MKKCSSAQVAAQPIAGYCIGGGQGARPRRNAALVRRGAGSMVAWRPESPPDSLPRRRVTMSTIALMAFATAAYWYGGWQSLNRSIEHFVSGVPIPTGGLDS